MRAAAICRFMRHATSMRTIVSQQYPTILNRAPHTVRVVHPGRSLSTALPTDQSGTHEPVGSQQSSPSPVPDVIAADNSSNPFQLADQQSPLDPNNATAPHPLEQSQSSGHSQTQSQHQAPMADTSVESSHGPTAIHDSTSAMTETVSGPSMPDGPVTVFGKISERIFTPSKNAAVSAAETATNSAESAVAVAENSSTSFSDLLLTPAMSILNGVHDITGLPWWLSIPIATITIRTVLLPATVFTMKNSAIMAALKDDISRRREAVMEAARSGDRLLAGQRQNEMQSFMRNAGVAPMRVLLGPLVQFPVFISIFVSIRRLAADDPTMATEGLAWFSDLSVQDPYYLLPIVCGATLMAMTELGGDTGSAAMTPQMKLAMRVISALSVPLTYWFPSAVFCYWIPNNIFSLSLGAAMRAPNIKKSLGLIVDPANIPGTRAAQVKAAQLMSGGRRSMPNYDFDPAAAAASYGAKRSAIASGQTVKPVLFKSKPKKAKAIS